MKLVSKQSGFTLIEMIVSLALFSVVVTVSIGALLMLVGTNEDLQGEQSVMTNLSFALDSMTREIRTGTRYYCVSSASYATLVPGGNLEALDDDAADVRDCSTGSGGSIRFHGIAFIEAGDSITGASANRIMYVYDRQQQEVLRQVGNNAPQSIISSGLDIVNADFFVTGSEAVDVNDLTPNFRQPAVTIHIEAQDALDTDANPKSYFVQTTVTQRTLDI